MTSSTCKIFPVVLEFSPTPQNSRAEGDTGCNLPGAGVYQHYAWVFSLLTDTLMKPKTVTFPSGVIFLLGRPVRPPPCLSLPPSPQTRQNPGSQRSSHYSGREATLGFQHRPSRTPKPRFFLLHYVVFPRVSAQLRPTQLLPVLVVTVSFKCILRLNSNLVTCFSAPREFHFS